MFSRTRTVLWNAQTLGARIPRRKPRDKSVFAILADIGRQDGKHDLRALESSLAEMEAFLLGVDDDKEGDDSEVDD